MKGVNTQGNVPEPAWSWHIDEPRNDKNCSGYREERVGLAVTQRTEASMDKNAQMPAIWRKRNRSIRPLWLALGAFAGAGS